VRVCWRVLVLTLAILLFGLHSSRLEAADTITAIEITGNRTVGADAVRSHLKLAQGSAYDAAKADQSIKALFARKDFDAMPVTEFMAALVAN